MASVIRFYAVVPLSYQLTMLRPNRKMIDAMAAINTEMAAKAKIGCPL